METTWGPHGNSIFVYYQTLNDCLRSEPLPYGQHIAIFKSRLTDPRSGVAFTISQRKSNQIILRKKHFPLKIIAPIWGVKPSPSKRGRRCNGTELLHFHGDEEEEGVGQGRSFGRKDSLGLEVKTTYYKLKSKHRQKINDVPSQNLLKVCRLEFQWFQLFRIIIVLKSFSLTQENVTVVRKHCSTLTKVVRPMLIQIMHICSDKWQVTSDVPVLVRARSANWQYWKAIADAEADTGSATLYISPGKIIHLDLMDTHFFFAI